MSAEKRNIGSTVAISQAAAHESMQIEHVRVGDDDHAVRATRLHTWLGIKRDFSNWIKTQIQRGGFIEGVDFVLLTEKGEQTGPGGSNRIEYLLSLDTAKHIALMSGSATGREVRRYFIAAERELNRLVARIGMSAAEQFGRLERDRELIEARASKAGRDLGSVTRLRRINDAAAARLLAVMQPELFGVLDVLP
jgi:phage anti-repressor protein